MTACICPQSRSYVKIAARQVPGEFTQSGRWVNFIQTDYAAVPMANLQMHLASCSFRLFGFDATALCR
jgi:hypothetical protein